jgi:hypothetical protein
MSHIHKLRPLIWLVLAPALLCGAVGSLRPGTWRPHTQTELLTHTVYAYRGWQSTSVRLAPGDRVRLIAKGEWQYSPVARMHDANGGLWAPDYYPLGRGRALGGALIGRIGDNGEPFFVGRRSTLYAEAAGFLYLRINDDLLGDNRGQLSLTIERLTAPAADGVGR